MDKDSGKRITLESEAEAILYKVGSGILTVVNDSPWDIAKDAGKAETYRNIVKYSMKASKEKLSWKPCNSFVLHRGPYVIGACLDESVNDKNTVIKGNFVDLLEYNLPIRKKVVLKPDENCLLYDIDKVPLGKAVEVDEGKKAKFNIFPIAGACRVSFEEDLMGDGENIEAAFKAEGPLNVHGIIRFAYAEGFKPTKCVSVIGKKKKELKMKFHEESRTFTVEFENNPDGIGIIFEV